jgi:hypothetical protein
MRSRRTIARIELGAPDGEELEMRHLPDALDDDTMTLPSNRVEGVARA